MQLLWIPIWWVNYNWHLIIIRETPDCGPYLPVSRLTYQELNFSYFALSMVFKFFIFLSNISSLTPVCHCYIIIIRSNVTIPTTSFLCIFLSVTNSWQLELTSIFCSSDIMCHAYNIVYHLFPINSQYFKTWGLTALPCSPKQLPEVTVPHSLYSI